MKKVPLYGLPFKSNNIVAFALVDDEDFEMVNQRRWYKNSEGYAVSNGVCEKTKRRIKIYMHKLVMPSEIKVDHKNRNRLDNQRQNLRLATDQQNGCNSKLYKNNKTGFRGVSKPKNKKYFVANITKNGKILRIGSFSSAEIAARAYDQKAKEIHGAFATLNFPLE